MPRSLRRAPTMALSLPQPLPQAPLYPSIVDPTSRETLWSALNNATALSAQYVSPGFFFRNGNSAQVPEEIAMLREAALQPHVRTICEVCARTNIAK